MKQDHQHRPVGQSGANAAPAGKTSEASALREVDVGTILGGHREVMLRHDGALYRLRITMNNKLILTK